MPPRRTASTQTSILSHLKPTLAQGGPSRARSTRNTKPIVDLSDSGHEELEGSEGSEGLDHIKLRKGKRTNVEALPMTQKRNMKKTVQDSEDEDDYEEEESDIIVVEPSPTKRRGKGKRKHRDDASDTDPDEEFISYPLHGWIPPQYRGTHSQKVQRRNERLEAVEIARKKRREENLTDDEIEVFPSPPSPRRGNKRTRGRNVVEGKGKGKAEQRDSEDEDDVVPISPPQKRGRGRPPKRVAKPSSSSTRPGVRSKLDLIRTKSEVIVEIPRMSQEERRSYTPVSFSQSSQSKGKGKAVEETSSSSRSRVPVVEIPSRKASPARESISNGSLPPILEVELSDRDLDILTDDEKGDKSKRGSTKSKSPVKKSSPVKQPSPTKHSSPEKPAIAPEASSSKRKSISPAKQPSPAKGLSPPLVASSSRLPSPVIPRPLSPSPAPSSDSVCVVIPTRKLDKGKGKQKAVSSESESEGSVILKKQRKPASLNLKHSNKHSEPPSSAKKRKIKNKIVDPDEEMEGDIDDEDMLDDLKMDEPERFKSATRLRDRPKETPAQRNIRKLKNKRLGIIEATTEEEDNSSSNESAPTDDEKSFKGYDQDDFIVPDDSMAVQVQLPHEFSVDSAQTPEFKFKVVFHYLVLLVIKGRKAFPLSAESSNYFKPQLHHFRDRMTGYRQLRVRSQIWRYNFVKALEKYPIFDVEELLHTEPGCDACHMGGRMSRFRISLEGEQYDKETHQPLDSSSEDSEDSEISSDSEAGERMSKKLPRSLLMGRFCKQRAEVFHQMTHWEDELYHRIRGYYRDLLRAKYKAVPSDSEASTPDSEQESDENPNEVRKRREDRKQRKLKTEARCEKIRKKGTPDDYRDVDVVTEWMDKMGYQTKDFKWIERLIEASGQLEHDKRKDE
ncbi:hypothetical protein I302_103884 [Kwoniella bestiolae CBS 10118]|uniref:DUF4211 domain-containing protein n=1 Tax=Kwoniella bestiolae CBS 10118 TaxID=1296100 RepID=A0A1B9G9M9_9TREE|nr:hypothetical protein I302_02590 [Kwoniella bestiolae CBS 10118]OCF27744.1 hypothetical protein I302_02590 [Kwoniella bestiolae CBS 10118]